MRVVPSYIESLDPYKPGKPIAELQRELGIERVVKLASNENPLGSSPKAIRELTAHLAELHRYPNGGLDLRENLAGRFSLALDNVLVGSGSEGILSTVFRTFLCDDDELLTSEGTFVGFYVLARASGNRLVTVPMKDYHYDLKEIARSITPRTKIVYLANPNNPTGTIFSREELELFMASVPDHVLIVLDEAYFEYACHIPSYPDSMHYRYDNVITLRTFSKIYGLAGLRIGYGFAQRDLIGNLLKVKLPFEPSTLAQAAGIAALSDAEFLAHTLEVNTEGLKWLSYELGAMGLQVVPSAANFVMIPFDSESTALAIYQDLLNCGIIVRPLRQFGLPHCLRITIGRKEDNRELCRALQSILPRYSGAGLD